MIAVDTNLIIRYLTGDHPDQSPRAREIIDGQAVFAAVTVVLEVEWVLRSTYGFRAPEVARALRAFGGLETVTVEDAAIVSGSLDAMEEGMDFADALHLGKSAHCEAFLTFDRKFVKAAQTIGRTDVRKA
jgi:predicted nucleic-acid-binding protein